MVELFDKHGGFRKLHSFTLATIIQVETLKFCRRFLTYDTREAKAKFYDPKGRQYDQMVLTHPPKLGPLTELGFPCRGIWNDRRNQDEETIQ